MPPDSDLRTRPVALALVADAVCVVVFCTIGRRSHAEGLSVAGIAETAWPFLAGAGGWQDEFLTAVGLGASAFILYLLARHGHQRLFSLALALILGGAIGNLIDRIVYGHVIDFLDVHWRGWHWPAFNVADSAIVCGAALLIVEELMRVRRAKYPD